MQTLQMVVHLVPLRFQLHYLCLKCMTLIMMTSVAVVHVVVEILDTAVVVFPIICQSVMPGLV